ncbi:MAG TPA: hypothetical protein VGI39_30715, partial [Polyangiaceae bacterium]
PPSPPPPSPPAAPEAAVTANQVHLESDTTAPPTTTIPEAPPESPPPLPRHKGFVAEGGLGGMGFFGQFRHVAPTAPWLHLQFGYEFFRWLMLFGEGELGYTDTSEAQDPTHSFAFAMYGFGAGLRGTVHLTDRVALFAQGSLDAMKADVPRGALQLLGYKNAESLSAAFGGRLGLEWYQLDRHMALGLAIGARDATGFAKVGKSDAGLMADASALIRYTF